MAIGGALALAIAGVPRGTADVDINVFVVEEQVPDIVAVFLSMGIEAHLSTCVARAKSECMFVARWDGMRIDVFLPSIAFAHEAATTRIQVHDGAGWTGWFLAAEAIAVFKLLFFRGKDIVEHHARHGSDPKAHKCSLPWFAAIFLCQSLCTAGALRRSSSSPARYKAMHILADRQQNSAYSHVT